MAICYNQSVEETRDNFTGFPCAPSTWLVSLALGGKLRPSHISGQSEVSKNPTVTFSPVSILYLEG